MTVTREQLDAYGYGGVRHGSAIAEPVMVGLHFQLAGYVCGAACFRPQPATLGLMTFVRIYNMRPDGCRFAIGRLAPLRLKTLSNTAGDKVDVGEPCGDWLCWDLLDNELLRRMQQDRATIVGAPTPMWQSPSKDGLIMKAMALYGRD